MTKRYFLSIIIVSFNTRSLTLDAIDAVTKDLKSSEDLAKKTQIIVVDNNSDDGSYEDLKELTKTSTIELKTIRNKKNVGFAVANNQGMESSDSEFILLLNSDTKIQTGSINTLLTTFQQFEKSDLNLGILAPALLNPNGSVQAQGGDLPGLRSLFFQMTLLDDLPIIGQLFPSIQHTGQNKRTPTYFDSNLRIMGWVAATAMMFRSSLVAEIGPLDKNIFMYAEDIEFCIRARAHGYQVAIQEKAQVVHFATRSSTQGNAIIQEYRGLQYLWAKHKPLWQSLPARFILQIGALLRIIIFGTIRPDRDRMNAYQQIFRELIR